MYTKAFNDAVDHAMLYEVGGFWNVNATGARDGTNMRASGYVNDPNDAGGETKYGIAKNSNPNVDIANLDWETAKEIYFKKYWLGSKCDKLDGRVAVLHFDGAVNHGIGRASKFLQRAVGVDADGSIGPATIAEVSKFDPIDICGLICDQRADYYDKIIENNPSQEKYRGGWMRRISEMRDYTTDPDRTF